MHIAPKIEKQVADNDTHHTHGHNHHHVHRENVVLDIGGNIGALIIVTGPEWDECEIELSPRGNPQRFHNQVHERHFNGQVQHSAVYPDIQAGEYDVWKSNDETAGTVTIVGGQVTTLDWRGMPSA